MDDQRTNLPAPLAADSKIANDEEGDDLFDILWRLQDSRIEDQRCDMDSAPHIMPASRGGENEECTSDELFEMIFRCQVRAVCVWLFGLFLLVIEIADLLTTLGIN